MRYPFLSALCLACLLSWQSLNAQTKPKISIEVVKDIIASIPSPLEICFLMKDLGVPYPSEYLLRTNAPTPDVHKQKQALLLGAHITDAGYAAIYEQDIQTIAHFQACNQILVALKINKPFNVGQLQEFSAKKELDTLLTTMTNQTYDITDYLLEHNAADNIKVLIGMWLESLYITVSATQKQPSELLSSRIIDQGIIVAQLAILLSEYEEGNKENTALLQDLKTLETLYEPISIAANGDKIRDMKKINAYIIKLRNQWIQ